MIVTATEAKNRLGQMLDHCQREPVVVEKQGRRHSVLLSAAMYDQLVAAAKPKAGARGKPDPGRAFYARHKAWVDHVNAEIEQRGLWNDALRIW